MVIRIKNHIFPVEKVNEISTVNEYGCRPGAYIIVDKDYGCPSRTEILFDTITERDKEFKRIEKELNQKLKK